MTEQIVARQVEVLRRAMRPFLEAIRSSPYGLQPTGPMADFFAGNPQEMPLPEFVEALQKAAVPQRRDWYAYNLGDPGAQAAAAARLTGQLGLEVEPEDVSLTRGAFGALALALHAVVDAGDEVLFLSPPWFFYEAMILAARAVPVRVKVDPVTFDLDLDAIAAAITDRTRAIIVNSPNNPTGKIYPPATLEGLAALLAEAGERNGRPIYAISDESYSRILFDGNAFHSPARWYPRTFLVHTYSKSALAPGQRLGFLARPAAMPGREELREAMLVAGVATGFSLPDVLMQYALPDVDRISIDLDHLQAKRDRMVTGLKEAGYELHVPEATFYLMPRSPVPDDEEFSRRLAARNVFVLPGAAVEMPGYFRISVTATDEMIDFAMPVFAEEIDRARAGSG